MVRLEECPTCGTNKVKVKVFACPHFGECTAAKQIGELALCQTCEKWCEPKSLAGAFARMRAAAGKLLAWRP